MVEVVFLSTRSVIPHSTHRIRRSIRQIYPCEYPISRRPPRKSRTSNSNIAPPPLHNRRTRRQTYSRPRTSPTRTESFTARREGYWAHNNLVPGQRTTRTDSTECHR